MKLFLATDRWNIMLTSVKNTSDNSCPRYIRKYFPRKLNSICGIITRDCTHKLSDVIYFCATLLIHALIEAHEMTVRFVRTVRYCRRVQITSSLYPRSLQTTKHIRQLFFKTWNYRVKEIPLAKYFVVQTLREHTHTEECWSNPTANFRPITACLFTFTI